MQRSPAISFLVLTLLSGSAFAEAPKAPAVNKRINLALTERNLATTVTRPSPTQLDGASKKHILSDLELGFLAGMNFSYGKGEPTRSGNTRNAMSFSLTFEKPLSERFSLCWELGYIQRGVHTQLININGVDIGGDVNLDYLELPLLARYYLPVGHGARLFFTLGPNFALAINRTVDVASFIHVDVANRFSGYDINAIGGLGIEYPVTPMLSLTSTLRYTYGFLDIDSQDSYQTRGIQLLFGLRTGF